jgi:1-deoxy-D-xylulose-5-phosphate reductoisomerase
MKNITILGATGSIGTQTLDVIRHQPEDFKLIAVSANNNFKMLVKIIDEFDPQYITVMDKGTMEKVQEYCEIHSVKTEVLFGMEGLVNISCLPEVDMVVTSVVGMVGLKPTIEAMNHGKDIALANKETLVVAGELVTSEAKRNKINLLPVDSEHGAIFQCLNGEKKENVNKILLTASGGPFRGKKREELITVTSREALRHPKWNMGKKISIDSSTLMNKGLEVIEAHWLFGSDYDDIQVVVHPESIIHSMVEFKDGSIIAQLGATDMRLPIQYALNYPERKAQIVKSIDFRTLQKLTFEEPDLSTFPCLKLAFDAGKHGKLMPTILNSANEVCVELFLNSRISFYELSDTIEECMMKFDYNKAVTVENVIEQDIKVREYIRNKYN